MVRTEDACEIIKYALQNEIKVYLDGGWGVDALLKRESRIHNVILSILVYTFFSRMFDLMLPPVAKHSIVVA